MRKFLFALLLMLSFLRSADAQALVGGQASQSFSCGMWSAAPIAQVYASTSSLAISYCLTLLNAMGPMLTYVGSTVTESNWQLTGPCNYMGCPISSNLYNINAKTNTTTTGMWETGVAIAPLQASCSSGVYDGSLQKCIGGTATCQSGQVQQLPNLVCPAAGLVANGKSWDCNPEPLSPPQVVSYNSCEYQLNPGALASTSASCYISKTSGNGYCLDTYTTDGNAAVGSDAVADTSSDASPSNGGGTPGGSGSGSGSGSGTGSGSCGGANQPACTMTDTAAENSLNSIQQSLTDTSPAPDDPPANTADDLITAGADGGDTFSQLKGWILPAHTSTCPTPTFQLWGSTFVMDTQCTLAAQTLTALRAAEIVAFTLAAMFIVLKA